MSGVPLPWEPDSNWNEFDFDPSMPLQPLPSPFPSSAGDHVMLYGHADSLVWRHRILYVPCVPQPYVESQDTVASREWVPWKGIAHDEKQGTVVALQRSTDWIPSVQKLKLKAQTRQHDQGGWREFVIVTHAPKAKRKPKKAKIDGGDAPVTIDAGSITVRRPDGTRASLQSALEDIWKRLPESRE